MTGVQTCALPIWVFDASTGNFRKPAQEIGSRSGKLVATDESPVIAKPLFDPAVMEDRQSNQRLSNPTSTDQSDRIEIFCKTNNSFH